MTEANTATHPVAKPILPGDNASLDRFLDGIAAAFHDTRLSRAFITEIDDTPPPYPSPTFNIPRIRRHIGPGITDAFAAGAELVEAGDYSALAVWETTAYRGKPFSETLRNVGPVREQWRMQIRVLKEKHIGFESGTKQLKPFYYLGFLVRNPEVEKVPGALSAVMKPWLQRAEAENVPVWLEATMERAVQIYEHYGFRLVETVRVGEGLRSAEGWPEEGGRGVCGYAMIYDQHLRAD